MESKVIKQMSIALAMILLSLFFCACSIDSLEPLKGEQLKQQTASRKQRIWEGVVSGPDFRMCPSPCCGGWIIMIDSAYYTFSDFPASSGIDPSREKFPLNVELTWSLDTLLHCNHIFVRWMRVKSPESSEPTEKFTSSRW